MWFKNDSLYCRYTSLSDSSNQCINIEHKEWYYKKAGNQIQHKNTATVHIVHVSMSANSDDRQVR